VNTILSAVPVNSPVFPLSTDTRCKGRPILVLWESGNSSEDEFGSQIFNQGTTQNVYRYTGQQSDADSGLQYLRARYYEPATGRFITQDPKKGDMREPATYNQYIYCRNNPIRYTDPSGLDIYIYYSDVIDDEKSIPSDYKYSIDWKAIKESIAKATMQDVYIHRVSCTKNIKPGRPWLSKDTTVLILVGDSNLGQYGSAAGGNFAIQILKNSWFGDFEAMARADLGLQQYCNKTGFSFLATNKILQEFYHALFGSGQHSSDDDRGNVMHQTPTEEFMKRNLDYTPKQREKIYQRLKPSTFNSL
jgi:RHS repeat-associated protein